MIQMIYSWPALKGACDHKGEAGKRTVWGVMIVCEAFALLTSTHAENYAVNIEK